MRLVEAQPARVLREDTVGRCDPPLALEAETCGATVVRELDRHPLVGVVRVLEFHEQKERMRGAGLGEDRRELRLRCRDWDTAPPLALRSVSDSADQFLPVPFDAWFDTRRQRARPLALLLHLLRHPSHIAPFTRFISRLPRIAAALAQAVEAAVRNDE